MATATEVISRLATRGVTFQIEESGGLRVNGISRLSEQERAALKAHKPDILKALASTTATTGCKAVAGPTTVTAVSITNRQAMPQIAAVVDQLREIFGPVRVIYAAENGRELGQVPDPGVITYPPHIPSKPRKKGQL